MGEEVFSGGLFADLAVGFGRHEEGALVAIRHGCGWLVDFGCEMIDLDGCAVAGGDAKGGG